MDFDAFKELLKGDRTFRRFDESKRIDQVTAEKLVDLTRYCASGRNLQPLRYRIVTSEEECERVFPSLKWAGYLTDWDGPEKGERPVAYLIQCLDTALTENPLCDDGLQLQALTLGARTMGLGACIIKSFNVIKIKEELHLPEKMKPLYVLALGVPKEKVEIEKMTAGDIKYWRDENGVHHVPKRELDELVIKK